MCLRKNPTARNATEVEVFNIIKVWLRTALDRHGGINERRQSKARETAEAAENGEKDLEGISDNDT